MSSEKNSNRKKRSVLSVLLSLIAGLLVLLMLVVLIGLPLFISSQTGNRIILDQVNTAVDGTAHFDRLSMGWRSGINIQGLHFETPERDLRITADEFSTVPSYLPLLRGHIAIGETLLVKPDIFVDLADMQPEPEKEIEPVPGETADEIPRIPLHTLQVNVVDGHVRISQGETLLTRAENINIDFQLKPGGQQTLLSFSAEIPAKTGEPSSLTASGGITPEGRGINRNFQKATGAFSVNLQQIDLHAVEPFLTAAGLEAVLSGSINGDINASIHQGMIEMVRGSFAASGLRFGGTLLQGDIFSTRNLTLDADIIMDNHLFDISRLDIKGDYFSVSAEGSLPTTLDSLDGFLQSTDTRLRADLTCNIATLAGQLKNTLGFEDQVTIRSGQLTAELHKPAGTDKSPLTGKALLSGLSGSVDRRQISLVKPVEISARIAPATEGIVFEQISLTSDFANVSGTGTDRLFNYRAQVDLLKMHNQIGSLLYSPDYSLSGRLHAEGKAVIEDKILLEGATRIENLRFAAGGKRAGMDLMNTAHKLTVNTADDTAVIDAITLEGDFGNVSVKNGFVPFEAPEAGRLHLPVSLELDIARLQPWLLVFAELPEGLSLGGQVTGDISLTSARGNFLVDTDNTRIRNLRLMLPDTKPVTEALITLKLNAKTDADIENYQAKWDIQSTALTTDGTLKSSATGGTAAIEGSVRFEYDWEKLLLFAGPFLPDGLVITGARNDTYQFSSRYPVDIDGSLLANLSASGQTGFDTAAYMGLNAGKTEIRVNVKNGELTIPVFETPVNNGTLRLGCTADFKKDPVMLKLTEPMDIISGVEINKIIANQLLQYVNPIFAGVAGISGQANLSCREMAIPLDMDHIDTAVLDATLSVENMTIQASGLLNTILSVAAVRTERQIMHIRPTRFMLEKGYVSYEDMPIEVDNIPINFKGRIGVVDDSLNMDVRLPYTWDGSTVRVTDETDMEQRISVPLKGTLSRPQIDVAGALRKGIMEEGIRRGLDRLFR